MAVVPDCRPQYAGIGGRRPTERTEHLYDIPDGAVAGQCPITTANWQRWPRI
jgi:hypothetical protein